MLIKHLLRARIEDNQVIPAKCHMKVGVNLLLEKRIIFARNYSQNWDFSEQLKSK